MAVDLLNLLLFLLPTIINEAAAACGPGAYYNASGSVEIPFPQPPTSSGVPDNYTLFTRLAFPSGPHGLSQSFGAVNASGYPVLDLSLDYQGCLLVLEGSSFQATKDHVNAPNKASCEAALSQDCIDDIIESANERANQISRDNGTTNWKCHISMPSKCNKIDSKYSSSIFQPSDPLPSHPSNSSDDCRDGVLSSTSGFKDGHKLSTYFKRLDQVTPILLMAWNNASSNPGGKPWSDTRFLCLSTDEIMPGSKSGAPSSIRPGWAGWYWGLVAVGLSVFM